MKLGAAGRVLNL